MNVSSKASPSDARPLALLVAAHPIWNVPPFINAALELSENGFRVQVIGYSANQLPDHEVLDPHSSILRLQLSARKLPWPVLRKPLAVLEFLMRARSTIRRMQPSVLITFNDPTCILQRWTGSRNAFHRVNWLLEYPELERAGRMERLLLRLSAACWNRADLLVVPTRERLALHLALRPECNDRRSHIVQNSPRYRGSQANSLLSPRTESAVNHLRNLKPGTLKIVYSGAIGNRYGIDCLIQAAASFPEGIQLLLLGSKHPLAEREVEAALKNAPFPQNVQWIDEVPYPELPRVLEACDVGFATYRGDTLNTRFSAPGKLYEYLKNGLVILSDSDCCIRADIESFECGVFFPRPVSSDGIHEALCILLGSPERIHKMKASSRALFAGRLCMEKQIEPLVKDLAAMAIPRAAPEEPARIQPIRPPYLKAG